MRAGSLDRRIKIEQANESQDPTTGEITRTPVLFAEVWAKRRQLRPWRKDMDQQVIEGFDTRFQIRFLEGIKPTMQIVDGDQTYDIRPPVEIGRRAYLEILGRATVE